MALMLHTSPFLLGFAVWFSINWDLFGGPTPLRWLMPLAAVWIPLGPSLMVLGEVGFRGTLNELARTKDDGWNLPRIEEARARVRSTALPVVWGFVSFSVFAYLLAQGWLESNLAIGSRFSVSWLMGLVTVLQLGASSGFGAWGVIQAVSLVHVATSTVVGKRNPPWLPFHPDQAPGIEALSYFSISTAVIFSFGSVMAPAILIVAISAGGYVAVFLMATVAVLLFGSSVLFLIPTYFIRRLTTRQRLRFLTELAGELQIAHQAARSEPSPSDHEVGRWTILLSYWKEAAGQTPHPGNLALLSRLPATVIVPFLSLVAAYLGLALKG